MFERRIGRVLAGIFAAYALFLARVFHLQGFEAEAAREEVRRKLHREVSIPPKRGTLRDAAGRVLAEDALGFDLLADPRGLGAREWGCASCGRTATTHEGDPGPGPADRPPLPAPPPSPRPCGDGTCEFRPSPSVDRGALAPFLGTARGELLEALERVRLEGWEAALRAAEGKSPRFRRIALHDWTSRSRRVLDDIPREAAMEVYLHPGRYPGMRVEPGRTRRLADDLDPATRGILGKVGVPWKEDVEALTAEGFTLEQIYRMAIGRSGLERHFDRLLRGRFGRERIVRSREGRILSDAVAVPVEDGEDLVLTLDRRLQEEAVALLGTRAGALVALEVADGAILAMVDHSEDGIPRSISGLAPGSVSKTLTALAAREGGTAPREGEVECRGGASRPIPCEHHHGSPGLVEALSGSCNAYFAEAGIRTGADRLQAMAAALRIAEPYEVGLYPEGGGTVWTLRTHRPDDPRWHRTDLANVGIGQGPVLLSPLQVAGLYAAVANGGRPVTPHLVRGRGEAPGSPVVSRATLHEVRAGLEGTVLHGTASRAGLGTFRAAGKTGTAQLGGDRGLNAWFAAYAPAEDPRVVVVVVLEDQDGSGGRVAAPLAARFLEAWTAVERTRGADR